jgi:hypothetical protein
MPGWQELIEDVEEYVCNAPSYLSRCPVRRCQDCCWSQEAPKAKEETLVGGATGRVPERRDHAAATRR